MELYLKTESDNEISVTCDGKPSHSFSLNELPFDPTEIGTILFNGLFREGSPTRAAWADRPKRILLVTEDAKLDGIPWEYLYSPDGFVVLDVAFVRGLPALQRHPAPDLSQTSLHIVAVPSNPIDRNIPRLDIAGEWARLKDSLHGLETGITLERVRPPTLDQTHQLLANQHNRIVHFMGHGGHNRKDSFLLFEDEYGAPKEITAKEFIHRIEKTAFLVTLNACVSATPGETEFSNLAHALTEQGVPYALGMRFPIYDEDAKAFSTAFYSELARGHSVEKALCQARNSLAGSENPRAVGTPVLYTSLDETAKGFEIMSGTPRIDEKQPALEVTDLPRAEGAFQGRVDELLVLGQALIGEPRVKLLTIHGAGGQGKTALAREATERFAHAWAGGVWAISLENSASYDKFTLELARFLNIDLSGIYEQVASVSPNLSPDKYQESVQQELENCILSLLSNKRTLLVLDNAEAFVEAAEAKDKIAVALSIFLREKVLSTQASLLVTTREHLGWSGEQAIKLELEGLFPDEGARLFWQSAPDRGVDAIGPLAQEISLKVEGHPLSLRLLGGAFDASKIHLKEFVHQVGTTLLQAEDKYKHEDHRHRTLYASIETSIRYLDDAQRELLSKLWIFQSPFQPKTAAQVFAPPGLFRSKQHQYVIGEGLHTLFQHGLLEREIETFVDGNILLYRSLHSVRIFARHYLEQVQPVDTLQAQMGKVYAALLQEINQQIDRNSWASYLAVRCREDLEASAGWVANGEQGLYANQLGWMLQRIGDPQAGLRWMEQGLAIAQEVDQELELHIHNTIAGVYMDTGEPTKALELYEQTLPLTRTMNDQEGEAITLNNMAEVYNDTGQLGKALELYEQALSISRAVGERAGEATTLSNMAVAYSESGQPSKALELYEEALSISRTVGERAGEATILGNMAAVYSDMGQPSKALELNEKALLMHRNVGDQAGEAAVLNNIAGVYNDTNQPGKALELYEQALATLRKVGNRAGEANTLNNMAVVYSDSGQPSKALELYEQALPIVREVDDRMGEANTLTNISYLLYSDLSRSQNAIDLLEQAIALLQILGLNRATSDRTISEMQSDLKKMKTGQPLSGTALNHKISMSLSAEDRSAQTLPDLVRALKIYEETSNRTGEAIVLLNIALQHQGNSNPTKALEYCEQAITIFREENHISGEVAGLVTKATLLSSLYHPDQAQLLLKEAISILRNNGLSSDAMGMTLPGIQVLLKFDEIFSVILSSYRKFIALFH